MAAMIVRLATLVALVLMPLGMTKAEAWVQPVVTAQSTMTLEDCGKHSKRENAPAAKMDCAASCVAIGAANVPALEGPLAPRAVLVVVPAKPFRGIQPETATPPPKRAEVLNP